MHISSHIIFIFRNRFWEIFWTFEFIGLFHPHTLPIWARVSDVADHAIRGNWTWHCGPGTLGTPNRFKVWKDSFFESQALNLMLNTLGNLNKLELRGDGKGWSGGSTRPDGEAILWVQGGEEAEDIWRRSIKICESKVQTVKNGQKWKGLISLRLVMTSPDSVGIDSDCFRRCTTPTCVV